MKELFQHNRLTVVHNNQGDSDYFHQYFPRLSPHQQVIIPSLSESHLRLRNKMVRPKKILIWDTRQVLLQPEGSPFMKELYHKLKEALGEDVHSQAILLGEAQTFLPEGYLDNYTAVVHIPYNVSTMSMFQQVRANIPIWVPSKTLLAKLWADPKEPNELSWTVFAPGTETKASTMDNVRNSDVIQRWVSTADFYNPECLPLALSFESIEDLIEKLMTTDYQTMMDTAEEKQESRRENIIYAWEKVLDNIFAKA